MAAMRLRADTPVCHASDDELVRIASAGDRDVFGELYRRHAPAARRAARVVAANDDDAADAAAEAFARVFDAIVSGRAPRMEFRAYLITASRNAAIDHLRRSHHPARLDPVRTDAADHDRPTGGRGPSEHLAVDEDSQLVTQAFQGLPARWQSVLWLTEVEGVPAREAAGLLGLSPNNVSQLAVRARARLRERYLQAHVRNHAQPRCQGTVDQLGAYLADTLTSGQRARVEAHLRDCDACRERLAEVEDLGVTLRRALVPAPLLAAALGWRRRGRDRSGPVTHMSSPPLGPPGGGGGATAAIPAAVSAKRSTYGGAAGAVARSPVFQALASLPVSAVAALVAVGPLLRALIRAIASMLALIPLLGSTSGPDARGTAVAVPFPPRPVAATVPTTLAAPAPSAPAPAPAAAPLPEAPPAPLPLPVTTHPSSIVAVPRGPAIDVFDKGATTPTLYLDNPQPSGAPLVLLVIDQQADWLQVLLPIRPNGSTGWVRLADVTHFTHTSSIVIELGANRITAFNGNEPFLSEAVAVGKSGTPTPQGLFYTKEHVAFPDAGGPYGPWALALSAFSDALFDFGGGDGVVAIHGTNAPSALGSDVSNGCIRMSNAGITTLAETLPPGVPVEIRA